VGQVAKGGIVACRFAGQGRIGVDARQQRCKFRFEPVHAIERQMQALAEVPDLVTELLDRAVGEGVVLLEPGQAILGWWGDVGHGMGTVARDGSVCDRGTMRLCSEPMRTPCFLATVFLSLLAIVVPTASAGESEDGSNRLRGLDPSPITVFDDPPESEPGLVARFGTTGQRWWTFGVAYANDLDDSNEFNANAAYSVFIAPDVEWIIEGGIWYHDQPGDNAFSGNASTVFRWHFMNEDRWSVFADVGIGLLASTDNVPSNGTSFNFTPRAALGYTRRIGTGQTRLVTGIRWLHISNAKIQGGDSNPGRDAPTVFFGVMIPF